MPNSQTSANSQYNMYHVLQAHHRYLPFTSNSKRRSMTGVSSSKANGIVDFDASCKTADVDISFRSACGFHQSRNPAKLIDDQVCLAGRSLPSCMKVKTQRDSLARISVESVMPTHSVDLPLASEMKTVRFDAIEIREYERGMSDNPSTSSGPPIGLGWGYERETIILGIDLYEDDRELCRRTKRELAIPAQMREDMLREAGYPRTEIKLATRMARKDKDRRNTSFRQQKFDPILETVDAAKHGMRRIIRRSSSSDFPL